MQNLFTVELTDMTFGGDALGWLPDGRAVFVPFGLPGEQVSIRLTLEKPTFAKGEIVEVLSASAKRITPCCPHFGQCGGCNYQHLAYPDQLEIKQKIVSEQLRRLGGLSDFQINPIRPAPSPWNYRNSLQFQLSPNGKLAFQRASSSALVEISECHLPTPGISDLWPHLELEPESGIQRVILREGAEEDLLLGLISPQGTPPEFSVDFPISVVFSSPEGNTVFSGEEFLLMQVNNRNFKVSLNSFFQANVAQAEAMVDRVLELAGELSGKVVVDAYCGVGLFSAFMASQAAQVIGIELSDSSCDDYADNLNEFDNVSLYMGAVEEVLPGLKVTPDIFVVDPPRAGLDQHVIASILASHTAKIIYVSCDPATLARDVKRFTAGGYALQDLTPFDQFPQTYHIETISLLTQKDS